MDPVRNRGSAELQVVSLFTSSLEGAVANPGFGFKLQMVTVLTAGAIFVMWLGEQITERSRRASLIIFFSGRAILAELSTIGFTRPRRWGQFSLVVLGLVMVGVVAGTIAITVAARRVMIQIRNTRHALAEEAAKNFILSSRRRRDADHLRLVGDRVPRSPSSAEARPRNSWRRGRAALLPAAAILIVFTYFTSIILTPSTLEKPEEAGWLHPGC